MTVEFRLPLDAVFALVAVTISGFAGWYLSKRVVTSLDDRQARQLFKLWCYVLVSSTLINGILSLFGAFSLTNLPLFLTTTYANLQI